MTIRSIDASEKAVLACPNREISYSKAQLYADAQLKNKRSNTEILLKLLPALRTGKTADVIGFFNAGAEAIDQLAHPIQDAEAHGPFMQVLFHAGLFPEVCRRIDRRLLVVENDAIKWVFEFEVANNASEVPKLLEEAVRRIEQSHHAYRCGRETEIRIGLVFDGAARRFSACRRQFLQRPTNEIAKDDRETAGEPLSSEKHIIQHNDYYVDIYFGVLEQQNHRI